MLDTGECVYEPMAAPGLRAPLASKGERQRVHEVRIRDGHVEVKLNTSGERASDYYQSRAYKERMQSAKRMLPPLKKG